MGRGAGGGGRGRVPIKISEGIAGRFAGAPREHIALVQSVDVRKEDVFEVDSARMGGQRVVGSAEGRKITLGRGASRETVRHELGHVVYDFGLTREQRLRMNVEFNRARRSITGGQDLSVAEVTRLGYRGWISGYGLNNNLESFAEGYTMWTNPRSSGGRERVARVAPELAAVLAETTGIGI